MSNQLPKEEERTGVLKFQILHNYLKESSVPTPDMASWIKEHVLSSATQDAYY